jgi:hypothetical protein
VTDPTVAVITSIYGGYDQLAAPPPQDLEAEWLCVTDRPDLDGQGAWKVVYEPKAEAVHPRLAAKIPKCLPRLYTSADVVVWVDGSCRMKEADTLRRLVMANPLAHLSQFAHPDRDCSFEEGAFSALLPKYIATPIPEQMAHYQADGYRAHWGLWATGVIVWNFTHGIELLIRFGQSWLIEQLRWTIQDQVSEAVVLQRHGLRPSVLPGNLWANDLVGWAPHNSGL